MAFWFFAAGSAVALAGLAFHGVVGHRGYVRAILASELPTPLPELSYVSWHVVSITFLSYALAMGYLAISPEAVELAVMVALICGATAALFLLLAALGHSALLRLPGAYLNFAIALLAVAGIYSS